MLFETDENNNLMKRLEAGHSEKRILYNSDTTGKSLQEFLFNKIRNKSNIEIIGNQLIFDLIVEKGECTGVRSFDKLKSEIRYFYSSAVVLATGGCGALYSRTTNSSSAIGSGIYLAKTSGIRMGNLEYIQFHPTTLKIGNNTLLLSEALRGDGAKIVDRFGVGFGKIELLTRDVLSQLLYSYIQSGIDLYLNCSDVPEEKLRKYEYISEQLKVIGLDLRHDNIPIAPAAHYMCGGIATNVFGKTSLDNLYAIGETACTGLHGTNRLASNSLTEAITMGYLLCNQLTKGKLTESKNENKAIKIVVNSKDFSSNIAQLQEMMWANCGIAKEYEKLKKLLIHIQSELDKLRFEHTISADYLRYKIMLVASQEIVVSSMNNSLRIDKRQKEKPNRKIEMAF